MVNRLLPSLFFAVCGPLLADDDAENSKKNTPKSQLPSIQSPKKTPAPAEKAAPLREVPEAGFGRKMLDPLLTEQHPPAKPNSDPSNELGCA
jgi:hypothetical protein